MTRCFFCRADKEDDGDLRCKECKAKDERGELDRTMSMAIKGRAPKMFTSYEQQAKAFRKPIAVDFSKNKSQNA